MSSLVKGYNLNNNTILYIKIENEKKKTLRRQSSVAFQTAST